MRPNLTVKLDTNHKLDDMHVDMTSVVMTRTLCNILPPFVLNNCFKLYQNNFFALNFAFLGQLRVLLARHPYFHFSSFNHSSWSV